MSADGGWGCVGLGGWNSTGLRVVRGVAGGDVVACGGIRWGWSEVRGQLQALCLSPDGTICIGSMPGAVAALSQASSCRS